MSGQPSGRFRPDAGDVPASTRAGQLTAILEAAPDFVGSFAPTGQLSSANAALRQLLGAGEVDLEGVGLGNLLESQGLDFVCEWAIPCARRLGTWSGDLTFVGASGLRVPVSVVFVAHGGPDADGPISLIARDLSERLRAEEELRSRLAAEAASRAKSDFLAVMSHEIRTPLAAVIGMTDLLHTTALSSEQREYVEAIRTSGDHLLSLVSDILDLSKIEAGQVELDTVGFDLRAVVEEVGAILAESAQARRVQLTCQVDSAIPGRLRGDPARLRQVLVNLVGNAVKFTEDGDVLVAVRPAAAPAGGHVDLQFEVSDTGIGIAPDAMARLFSPFSQGDGSMSRRYGGSGLGLVISRQLVSRMGGDIGVESREGVGSTFWFTVRLAIDETREATGVANAPAADVDAGEPVADDSPVVLLVEDNPINQKIAAVMLRRLGVEVDVVADGQEAVAAVRRREYRMVFMDCQLPGMDGVTATETIRAGEGVRRVPIVAVTANGTAYDRDRCLAAGMDGYLVKPVRPESLAAALARWMPGARV